MLLARRIVFGATGYRSTNLQSKIPAEQYWLVAVRQSER